MESLERAEDNERKYDLRKFVEYSIGVEGKVRIYRNNVLSKKRKSKEKEQKKILKLCMA